MCLKIFLIAASITVSALLSTQDSFAGSSSNEDNIRIDSVKKVDIWD